MASQSVYSPIPNGYPPRPAVQWNPFLGWVSEARSSSSLSQYAIIEPYHAPTSSATTSATLSHNYDDSKEEENPDVEWVSVARPSSSLSQYALIGPYHPPTSSGATSATPSHSYDDLEEAVSRSHADASRMSHQQDHPVFDPSADCIQPVDMNMHSFSSSFGSRSTPSENYDEDAENIDPNSPERKGKKSHRPFSAQFRVTHILRDSQTFPLADAAPEESQQIAAPVPLSYSARSKEVLSAMISPVQPSGLPNPIAAGPQQPSNDRCTYTQTTRSSFAPVLESVTNFSSNASQSLHYNYPTEMAQYTTAPRRYIRPISPSTLIALTEPFLMVWCRDYPMPPAQPIAHADGSSLYNLFF